MLKSNPGKLREVARRLPKETMYGGPCSEETREFNSDDANFLFELADCLENTGQEDESQVKRTSVDFSLEMMAELEVFRLKMNISRQAVIKMMIRDYLDRHYLAQGSWKGPAKNP